MFTYYLAYSPKLWRGYEKRGLINDLTGIRFAQNIMQKKELMFNELAAKGGDFFNLIKDNKYSFYIDRLQGGCYFEGYDYDFNLVDTYKNLIGDKFIGFQMHEWLSNFRNDLKKLENCHDWTKENIIKTIQENFPFKYLFLESHSAKEFAQMGRIRDLNTFLKFGEELFKKRQNYTDNLLIPCDSYLLAYPLEIKLGAKRLMPEIGAQIPNTRLQVAFARGMAKAHNIPFGTYYEPWGGKPFSACLYNKSSYNEWNLKNEDFPFKTNSEEGGSSRSLQWRLYLYSYLAGAEFMSDEWGGGNTFNEFDDFELSPYGKLQLNLMNFVKKYSDLGDIYTPICIILPKNLPAVDVVLDGFITSTFMHGYETKLSEINASYMDFELVNNSLKNDVTTSHTALKKLVAHSNGNYGNEHQILINSEVPDAFDVCTAHKIGDCYDYYVDLTGSLKDKKNVTIEKAKQLINELMPCYVSGKCHWFVNKAKTGWYLTVFNNDGIDKSQEGEKLMTQAKSTVKVEIKDERQLKFLEGNCKFSENNGKYLLEIEAGGWFFGKIL